MSQACLQAAHDVRGVGRAGQQGGIAVCGRADHAVGEAGADDEAGAGLGGVAILARVEYGAGPDHGVRDLGGYGGDRLDGDGGPQGDLDGVEASGRQGLGQRNRVLQAVDHQHRDHGRKAHHLGCGQCR